MPFRSSSCPPPSQQDQGVRLAAPATVGQVGGTTLYSRFLRFFSSRSLRLLMSLVMPMATMAANAMAISQSAGDTSIPFTVLLVWWLLLVVTVVLGCVIFHWVLVPLLAWAVRRCP